MSKSRIGNNVFFSMPVTLVGTVVQKKVNFMAVAWVSRVNAQPPEIGIGINKTHATAEGIIANKAFSVCFPNRELMVRTDYCGITSGKAADKSKLFKVFYGDIKSAPMIEECPLCLECQLTETVEGKSNYFFIGEIKGAFADDTCLDEGAIDPLKADYLLLTMPDNHYWSLGEKLGDAWKEGKKYHQPLDSNMRRYTMKNVEMTLEGNILTMKVDLSKEFGPSSSGKTIIIASTEGNVAVEGHEEAKVGLNVYRKKS